MKVLGNPRVRPDMVWALIRLLKEADGGLDESLVAQWMLPPLRAGSTDAQHPLKELLLDVGRTAEELGFIRISERWALTDAASVSGLDEFTDALHAALIKAHEWDILDTYASLITEVERRGMTWLSDAAKRVADTLRDVVGRPVPNEPDVVMNSTRWASWVEWTTFIGLGVPGPQGVAPFFPTPKRRLKRWLQTAPKLREKEIFSAEEFARQIAADLPYLDGGTRYEVARQRSEIASNRKLSRVLSSTLRDLHRDGVIALEYQGGDQVGALSLHPDDSDIQAFLTIRIGAEQR